MVADETFTLTAEHLLLLRSAYVRWEDCEFGAPAIDCKRPYGNSDVIGDLARLFGVPDYSYDKNGELPRDVEDRLITLHKETETALQVVLSTGSFEPGEYVRLNYRTWERE